LSENKEVRQLEKTANINIWIDPETKNSAEELFAGFGITLADAVNIFLHMSVIEGGMPFEIKQPHFSAETESAIRESREILSGNTPARHYSSARELFRELDAEEKVT
jgi:addiction module antitoxin, relB/dinJ family